jgi:hypothetical protein
MSYVGQTRSFRNVRFAFNSDHIADIAPRRFSARLAPSATSTSGPLRRHGTAHCPISSSVDFQIEWMAQLPFHTVRLFWFQRPAVSWEASNEYRKGSPLGQLIVVSNRILFSSAPGSPSTLISQVGRTWASNRCPPCAVPLRLPTTAWA